MNLTLPKGILVCFAECHSSWICLFPWGLKFGLCIHGGTTAYHVGGRSNGEEMDHAVNVPGEVSCEETLCPISIRAYTFIGSVWTVDFDAIFTSTVTIGLCWLEALFSPPTLLTFITYRLNICFILWIYPLGFWADLIKLSRKGEQISTSPGCCKSSPPFVLINYWLYTASAVSEEGVSNCCFWQFIASRQYISTPLLLFLISTSLENICSFG